MTKNDTMKRMLARGRGASVPEMAKATGWNRNSVRGAVSRMRGTLTISSARDEKRGTVYHVDPAA